MSLSSHRLFLTVLAGFASLSASAQDEVGHCPGPPDMLPRVLAPAGEEVQLGAQTLYGEGRQDYRLEGEVSLRQGPLYLEADQARYSRQTQQLEASGRIFFQQPGVVVQGDGAAINLQTRRGQVDSARYYLPEHGARGDAARVDFSKTTADLDQATYTTCDKPARGWELRARDIALDQQENEGVARHVRLHVAGVPVLYLPYISFPLAGRKSGFLAPTLGYGEEEGGDIALPYYLNLAPHRDATLTPRLIANRGMQLGAELRYLNPASRGELFTEYMPQDRLFVEDKARRYNRFRHSATPTDWSTFSVDYQSVSDSDYFRDLGGNFSTFSQSYLERQVQLNVHGPRWRLATLAQDFQMIDDSGEPYRRLPQTRLNLHEQSRFWRLELDGEFVRFNREDVIHQRSWWQPGLGLAWRPDAGFVETKAQWRSTHYRLDTGQRQSHQVPTFSLEGGLFFDRFDEHSQQSLEPRLQFIHVPFVEGQDQRFDTGLLEPGFNQLFQAQRYSGGDVLGDQRRLTLALTHRYLDGRGRERWQLSLAHSHWLADQQIVLPGEVRHFRDDGQQAIEAGLSPLVGMQLRAGSYYEDGEEVRQSASLDYRQGSNRANLDYRFRHGSLKQYALALHHRLNPAWGVAAGGRYSAFEKRWQETIYGVEYNSCCWSLRALGRRYLKDASGETNTSVALQLEMKGLTSVGNKLERRFSKDILGYQEN